MLTQKDVELALPANLKSAATQSLADRINNIASDPLIAEQVRENFVGYASVLRDGRFKTEDYLNAVAYVSYKLMGYNNQESYQKTFPGRWQGMITKGYTSKDMSAYVSAYHKGKLVNLIMEQTLTPVHVLNQDVYQKAINVQADLMMTAFSEKVRSDAANSLLTHLAKPKDSAPAINIDINQNTGMKELNDMLERLANKQLALIEGGMGTREIAAQPLLEGRVLSDDQS